MATLWEVVTGNSTLPVAPGNTFWDHINNPSGEGGGDGEPYPVFYQDIQVAAHVPDIRVETTLPKIEIETADVSVQADDRDISINTPTINVEVDK